MLFCNMYRQKLFQHYDFQLYNICKNNLWFLVIIYCSSNFTSSVNVLFKQLVDSKPLVLVISCILENLTYLKLKETKSNVGIIIVKFKNKYLKLKN